MKSQRTDAAFFRAARLGHLGRRDVGDAITAAQFSPRVEIFQRFGRCKKKYLANRANQLSSCSARHRCPAAVESEKDGQ